MHRVSSVESGHRYDAIGVLTSTGNRAYGRYQVMDYNVGNWTEYHLGIRMTVSEFIEDQLAQETLVGIMFTERIGKYKNLHDPVALWFSGQPLHGNTACDANKTCVPEYVQRVLLSSL